jgi:PAS domain S-box-containing protein
MLLHYSFKYPCSGDLVGSIHAVHDITPNKKIEKMNRQYSYDLERLLAVSRDITTTTDLRSLYRTFVSTARDLLALDFSTLLLLSEDKKTLTIQDCLGFPETLIGQFRLVEGQGLSTLVAKSKKPEIVADFTSETRFEVPPIVREKHIHSAVAVPMMMKDEIIGILIGHTLDLRDFSPQEVSLYQQIGNQAAVAIKNAMSLEALRKSEKYLHDITSHMAEGLYVIDRCGRITFINEEAIHLLGWTQAELNETGVHELVHYRNADGSPLSVKACSMHNVINSGKRYVSNDDVFVRRDGTVFPVSVVSSPILEDGKVVASVNVFRDITETKRLEQEVSRAHNLKSVGILAGGIAHDFNNLLYAILGYIGVAKMRMEPDDKAYQSLTDAELSCNMASELSSRLITFSTGGEPNKEVLYLSGLLVNMVNTLLQGSRISPEFYLPDNLYTVLIDERQIKRVVDNLVLNAKEAMPNGGKLIISGENQYVSDQDATLVQPGKYVIISVSDNGAGIPSEHLAKIFDPYFSTKDTFSEKGLGLGLAVCYSIIKKHDGLMTVESEVGKGTTFHIYLPAAS